MQHALYSEQRRAAAPGAQLNRLAPNAHGTYHSACIQARDDRPAAMAPPPAAVMRLAVNGATARTV